MITKFTKGPWKATVSNNGRHQISGDSGKQVCAMWNCKERDSNAALIACAPEMYEMLDNISDILLDVGGRGNHIMAKQIEALLTKARGES
jgi:hypothetical protein